MDGRAAHSKPNTSLQNQNSFGFHKTAHRREPEKVAGFRCALIGWM
jgi:hypothetical protein